MKVKVVENLCTEGARFLELDLPRGKWFAVVDSADCDPQKASELAVGPLPPELSGTQDATRRQQLLESPEELGGRLESRAAGSVLVHTRLVCQP